MKHFLLSIVCLLVPLSFAQDAMAKAWRGIVPLHSTRADVVRLFGVCSKVNSDCSFDVGKERVRIIFAGELVGEDNKCTPKVSTDTVLRIQVESLKPMRLTLLKIDRRNFRSFDPSSPTNIGYRGYLNKKEGLVITTFEGEVVELNYIASARDVGLCPGYYADPESFIAVYFCGLPPTVNISCQTKEAVDGDRIEFHAYAPELEQSIYTWVITAGKIIEGQGTPRIVVDTAGVGGNQIVATVEMSDSSQHTSNASCSTKVMVKPNERKQY